MGIVDAIGGHSAHCVGGKIVVVNWGGFLLPRGDFSGNAGLCGRFHRAVVEGGRTRPLSVRRQTLDSRGLRRWEQRTFPRLEVSITEATVRCPSPERHRLPLSAGSVQREPHRTSSLLQKSARTGPGGRFSASRPLSTTSERRRPPPDCESAPRQKEIRDRRASPTGRHERPHSFQTQNLTGWNYTLIPSKM